MMLYVDVTSVETVAKPYMRQKSPTWITDIIIIAA